MYKTTDVFLNADDCAKIAPYIPNEILKGWEWWWQLTINPQTGEVNACLHQDAGRNGMVGAIPALDVGILVRWISTLGKSVMDGIPEDVPYAENPFQNMLQFSRTAIICLIDQNLISPVEGREEL